MTDAARTSSVAERPAGGRRGRLGARAGSDRSPVPAPRGLFRKYVLLFVGLVSLVLLANGGVDFLFNYRESKAALFRIQQQKADAAARRIEQFIDVIEDQIGWTTPAQWAQSPIAQRRFDFVRLLHQVPAITTLTELDHSGKEVLKVSRLSMDVVGGGADYSHSPAFIEAVKNKVWFGSVQFRKQSEPYLTIAIAQRGSRPGVIVADVNLKLIWDVISSMKTEHGGYAYVVDRAGRLIADPDLSMVLRNTNLANLPQVKAARAGGAVPGGEPRVLVARGLGGKSVLSAHASIASLGWLVFVEAPLDQALAPLYGSTLRTTALLGLGLISAILAALLLARRIIVPIRLLEAGAARIGAGELDRRIEIHTGDEIEALADQFNRMAADLQESYAGLERKVEERTAELTESLEYQTAVSEVLKVISRSTVDLDTVLETVVETALRLCRADYAAVFRNRDGHYRWAVGRGLPAEYEEIERAADILPGPGTLVGRVALDGHTVQIEDAWSDPLYEAKDDARTGNVRSMLGVPLVREGTVIGIIALVRGRVEPYSEREITLVTTFADQSVIAIENARLFNELRQRTGELARSVEELRTLSEVGHAVSSTLDLRTVLTTVLTRSVALAGADAGAVFRFSGVGRVFRLVEAAGWDDALIGKVRKLRVAEAESAMGEAAAQRAPFQVADLTERPSYPLRDATLEAGFRSALVVPLTGGDRILGAMLLERRVVGEFPPETVRLMQTLASQSVLAIQNARLFREIAEKSEELELASQHKSQFLANMSHELRTPLNAILGYTELLVDGIYGDLADKPKGVLERIQNNGKHLLALINDVLDLAKIEAGQLTLTLEDYALSDVVRTVVSATEPLASKKGIKYAAVMPDDLPTAHGDSRRISQVVLNLVGNAIKFTDEGEVEVRADAENDHFILTVRDTGPGIAPENLGKIFGEFQQVDDSNTRKKGGTGLGLAISKRMVEMQGGTISVASEVGQGSIFTVVLPVHVEPAMEEAA